jgi:hypothetical protein
MATRFVHYILAADSLAARDLPQEEVLEYLAGTLLPDAAPFSAKKKTHFNRLRWGVGGDRRSMEKVLVDLPLLMRRGWEFHLDLDRLWQSVCFLPNLYRLPGLLLRYGGQIGKKYYEELSDFDLCVRERLPQERLTQFVTVLDELEKYPLPTHEWIDPAEWHSFLTLIRGDFTKTRKYQGPPFVGERSFKRFYKIGERVGEVSVKKI